MIFQGSARGALLLILGLALGLRAGFGLAQRGLEASTDERHWDRIAASFWQEGLLAERAGTYRPPLYPLLVAATYEVCGHRPEAVRLWQALLGTATCGLLFAVGRRLGGTHIGLIAAGLAAVYPLFIFFTGTLMAETLLVFLSVAVLLMALRLEEETTAGRACALGVVMGLGGLCKPVLVAWAPLLLWGWWRRARLEPRARWGRLAAVCGGLALAISPWMVRNYLMTGHLALVSTNLGVNLLIGHEEQATGQYREGIDYLVMYERLVDAEPNAVLADRLATRRVLGWMLARPLRTAELAGRKLVLFWSPWVTGAHGWMGWVGLLTSGPLLALGLWGWWGLRGSAAGWAIGALLLGLSLVHALIFAHTRFRLPIDAVLMGPAALALDRIWRKVGETRR